MSAKPLKVCNTCKREYFKEQDFLVNTTRWRMCERGNLWFNCDCNSTNMIIKGKFDWYSPEMFLSGEAKSVFNTLPALKELPHIPTSVMELQQLIRDENSSAAQMAKVSRQDPLIAGNILKIANNLKASTGTRIESLEHAISFIGLNSLSDIILTASIGSFPFKTTVFNQDEFWEESFLVGKIAEAVAQKFAPDLIADEVYLAGALANVGKVVLAICFPEEADKIAADCKDIKKLKSWISGEVTHNVHSHSVLGEIAASFWGLPEYILVAASSHHSLPTTRPEEPAGVDDVVRLANQLAHWVLLEPTKISENLLKSMSDRFRISAPDMDKLVEELIPLKEAS